jgi:hypothetical protein
VEFRLENITQFEATVDIYTGAVVGYSFFPSEEQVAEALFDYPDPDELDDLYSEAESDVTREIVERDERLAELLKRAETIASYQWPGANHIGTLIAFWDMSETVAGDYPVFVDRDHETGDYRSVIVPLNETNTRQLTVYVDLAREEIISVEPDEGD